MSDCAYDVNIVWVTLNELKRQAAVTFIILKKENLRMISGMYETLTLKTIFVLRFGSRKTVHIE